MFQVSIDGKKVNAEVSFYTALVYEQEFQKDMLRDLLGVQTSTSAVSVEDGEIVKVDFTQVNWSALAKALWAAVKTADDATPSFQAWMKGTAGLNLWVVNEHLTAEVVDCFFRSGAAGEETKKQEG